MNIRRSTPFVVAALLAVLADTHAQQPPAQPAPQQQQKPTPAPGPTPTFRTSVDLVSSDVIVRNRRGVFQADLAKDDFELFEDGIKQELNSFVLVHGGRAFTTQVAAPTPVREGIILPPQRPTNDAAGRIICFVVDDLHLDFRNTPRIRSLFKKMGDQLVHEGDLFGIVSTGTSSIAIDLTYDRSRIPEAANRITGGGMRPSEIVQQSAYGETPAEVTHRAHVAFETALDLLRNLESAKNRRKAVVLISNGYDFDPFPKSRSGTADSVFMNNPNIQQPQTDPNDPNATQQNPQQDPMLMGNQFADTDLAIELNEVARQANRSNATFYTIDPRGLVAGQDLDEQVDPTEWDTHLRKTQDTLRVLAEQTGGLAVVNTNDFDKALKRIDAETSDYYVLAYYSTNPDPT